MDAFSSLVGAGGPWAALLAMIAGVFTALSRGWLIPGRLHQERMHDKDTIIDILRDSNDRVLTVNETREQATRALIDQLTKAAEKFNGAGAGVS